MRSKAAVEVAVFTVRSPDSFEAVQRQTHAELRTLGGFRESLRLRGTTSRGLFADIIVWDSLEAAQEASARVEEDPRFGALRTSLDQVCLYAHYAPYDGRVLERLGEAPVVEITAYTLRSSGALAEGHEQIGTELRRQPGYLVGGSWRQLEDSNQFVEIVGWERTEDCEAASAALRTRPHLANLFARMGPPSVSGRFAPIGRSVA